MRDAFNVNDSNHNVTENETPTSYTFDYWDEDGNPHGGGGAIVGEEAANKFMSEFKEQNPELNITKSL